MREEKDALGSAFVPDDRYYGATTARSLKSFDIGWHRMPRPLIDALLLIKGVAAETNMELGLLSEEKGQLILKAIHRITEEGFDEEFPLSFFKQAAAPKPT